MKKIYIIPLLFAYSLFAQSTEEEIIVDVDFRLFLWPYESYSTNTEERNLPLLFWKDGSQYQPMEITLGETTPWAHYKGTLPMNIYVKWPKLQKKDQDVYSPYAKVTFPLESQKILIFIFEKNKDANGLRRAFASDASDENLKDGSCRILNLSKENLKLQTLQKQELIPAWSSFVLNGADYKDYRIPLYVLAQKKKKWKRVKSTFYKINSNSRMFFVFFESSTSKGNWKMMPISVK